jgi:Zn-finger nucleic acid-binding protein
MKCPKCKTGLKHETYENVEIDRCSQCKGTWLDEGELAHIIAVKEEKFTPELIQKTVASVFSGVPEADQQDKHPCPMCARPMRSLNYAYSSGIIIERCPASEGVWLDGAELERIQAHQEHWEKKVQDERSSWIALLARKTGT